MPRHTEPIHRVTRYGCGCWHRDDPKRCPEHGAVPDVIRWEARVDTGAAGSSKRKQQRRRFTTRGEARAWLAAARAAVHAGTYVKPSQLTLDAHLDAWLAGKRDLKPSTRASYRDALRTVREAIGHVSVQSVTKADLDALVEARLAAGRSPRTVALMLVVVQQALDDAMRQGLVARNVATLVERPRQEHREMSAWTLPQARRFLSVAAEDRLVVAWTLTLRGLRRGEVLGLRWDDVDTDAGTLSIRQSRVIAGGQVVTGSPKSGRGRRTLPLDPHLLALMKALRTRQRGERLAAGRAYTDSGLVVVDELGAPMRPELYSDRFARLARVADVPVIRLHDARHTAATLMLELGTPVHVVAAWLGHDPAVTHRTYAHAHDAALRVAGDTFGRALSGA